MKRTWLYVKSSGETMQHYVSGDGYEIWKTEEDYPTQDFFWQLMTPAEIEDGVDNANAQFCTAKAAKAECDLIYPVMPPFDPTHASTTKIPEKA